MSKIQLFLVTLGIITAIIGILTGCAQLLNGSLLVENHNIMALPVDWPNQEFNSKMGGMPVFTLLTGIPYYVVGLVAIFVSVTLLVCSLTIIDVSKFGIFIFTTLNIAFIFFGVSKTIPLLEGLPTVVFAILALKIKQREKSDSSKRKFLVLFNFFFWWYVLSWVLWFPGLFVLSFYQEIPQLLFKFTLLSMPISTIGALVAGLIYDKSVSSGEI